MRLILTLFTFWRQTLAGDFIFWTFFLNHPQCQCRILEDFQIRVWDCFFVLFCLLRQLSGIRAFLTRVGFSFRFLFKWDIIASFAITSIITFPPSSEKIPIVDRYTISMTYIDSNRVLKCPVQFNEISIKDSIEAETWLLLYCVAIEEQSEARWGSSYPRRRWRRRNRGWVVR